MVVSSHATVSNTAAMTLHAPTSIRLYENLHSCSLLQPVFTPVLSATLPQQSNRAFFVNQVPTPIIADGGAAFDQVNDLRGPQ